MNIELSWQKNSNLFITEEPIKERFFYLSSSHLQSKGNTFISLYLLAYVQLPFPLTHRLVN